MERDMGIETLANLPLVLFDSLQEWESWLDAHHARPQGVWLKIAKKGAPVSSVSYADALDAALCYGWIDGQKKPYDSAFWLQKFTPRRPKSGWSKINTGKAIRLIEAGAMTPAGQREVDAAKQDGRWDAAYESQSNLTIPDDFQVELDRHPQAKAFFDTLNKVNRYAMCYRIATAKKPETRQARIDKFIVMLAQGEKIYP
ncbi:MAG: YdeI/OmpD-associated family protein [Chloroflexota bacterium]|nr:YdeI/OmpD-associated family protein [Chloroflexota bacterium]